MRPKKLLTTLAIVTVVLIAGCKKDDFVEVDGLCPLVISTSPVNGAVSVPLNMIITVTFNKAMNPATITQESFSLQSQSKKKSTAADVPGTITYNDLTNTASFTPSSDLETNATYSCRVTEVVKDLMGNALQVDYVFTFSTGLTIIPMVVSTDPANNAVNVFLNKIVTATFSVPMNSATIDETTFTLYNGLTQVAGAVTYIGSTASFNPDADLLSGILYTATITTGAKNSVGTPIANDYVWTFTTGSAIAPTVESTDPADLEANVLLNKVITATFSEAMDPLTITDLTFIIETSGGIAVTGTVDLDLTGLIATFTPDVNLLSDSTYVATITTGAENVAGTPIASDYVWEFYTGAHLGPLAPPLGGVKLLGAAGGTAGLTNQGLLTTINNGGISTTGASTLVTGFHDAITGDIYTETPLNVGNVSGGIFTAPPLPGTATSEAIAQQAALDAVVAYNAISPASMPGGIDLGDGELGARTLAPGIYQSAPGSYDITLGDLTLDGQGDANAVWVFQMASTLTVGIAGPTGARSVVLINGAQAKNVYWYVGSQATINGAGGGIMVGTIIANSGVTFSTPGNVVLTVLEGRAISLIASVTMVNTTINVP